MLKNKQYIIISGIAVAALLLGGIHPTVAETMSVASSGGNKAEIDELNQRIAEKKEKVQALEKSIASYKEKVAAKQREAVSLNNQVSILDNRIAQVELDIEATGEKIDALTLEIESLTLSIEDKEAVITRQQDMMGELIRTIHVHDNKKYIEIAASYENFSDFYSQVQYVKTVESNLGTSARTLRLLKEELQDKKAQQEKQQASYVALKDGLEQKQKDLREQIYAKENLIIETRSSEVVFQTLLNQLKSQYQSVENEISGIEREIRQKLEAQDKLDSLEVQNGQLLLSWPTQSRYLTARFHDPAYPYRHVFEHSAVDIRSAQGTPLHASASGYVARARRCSVASCYAYVLIVHSNGISTLYGHMSRIDVSEGQFVARGDVIGASGAAPGTVGAGPFTTGPHLHFEVRKDGIPVNPLNYLVKDY